MFFFRSYRRRLWKSPAPRRALFGQFGVGLTVTGLEGVTSPSTKKTVSFLTQHTEGGQCLFGDETWGTLASQTPWKREGGTPSLSDEDTDTNSEQHILAGKNLCRKPPCQQVQRKFCGLKVSWPKKTNKSTGRYFWLPFWTRFFVVFTRVDLRVSPPVAFVFSFPSRKIVTKSILVKMWRWTWSLNSKRRAEPGGWWDPGLRFSCLVGWLVVWDPVGWTSFFFF